MIKITKKQACVGCYACANRCPKQCITLTADAEGFVYPRVDSAKCVECNLCVQVCPLLKTNNEQVTPQVFACLNKNAKVRASSSSGGTFTLLAEAILRQGGSIFGAVFTQEFKVQHTVANTCQELEAMRGSKYVQSQIGTTYVQAEQLLRSGKPVLFSGTGCQIAGLKGFLRQAYANLWTVDIVCHGVPSPKVYQQYLQELSAEAGEAITKVNFRDKKTGWQGFKFIVETAHQQFAATKQEDPYMRAFLNNLSTRPSCAACKFNNQRSVADITLADYWGVATKLPAMDDNQGTSLVLVNTPQGQELFDRISASLVVAVSTYEHAAAYNHALTKPNVQHPYRKLFFEHLGRENIKTLVDKLL
ncbi:MAG: Coenzyme F420 hydrogenase/dehydrogenase, beta subunit C-terminal domain [Acidaminococcaceae bacterium]